MISRLNLLLNPPDWNPGNWELVNEKDLGELEEKLFLEAVLLTKEGAFLEEPRLEVCLPKDGRLEVGGDRGRRTTGRLGWVARVLLGAGGACVATISGTFALGLGLTFFSCSPGLAIGSTFIVSPAFGYARTLVGIMVVPIVSFVSNSTMVVVMGCP